MNSILIHFARTDPKAYVRFALDMWRAPAGATVPFKSARVGWPTGEKALSSAECLQKRMESVDYILMASLMVAFFGSGKSDVGATADVLMLALKDIGFDAELITNETSFWGGWTAFENLLNRVSAGLMRRDAIGIAMMNAALPQGVHQQFGGEPSRKMKVHEPVGDPGRLARYRSRLHFMHMTRLDHTSHNQTVNLKIYTWGRSYTITTSYETLYKHLEHVLLATPPIKLARADG